MYIKNRHNFLLRYRIFLIVFFLISFLELLHINIPYFHLLGRKFNDLNHIFSYFIKVKPRIIPEAVFIFIDHKTDDEFKYRFPYPRHIITKFIKLVSLQEPKIFALNLAFIGESIHPEDDLKLIEEIKKRELILYNFVQPDGTVLNMRNNVSNAAVELGIVGMEREKDAKIRTTLPYFFDVASNRNYYCIELLFAMKYFGLPLSAIEQDIVRNSFKFSCKQNHLKEIEYGEDFALPFKHYYKKKDVSAVSFIDVINNRIEPDLFKDKVVIFGLKSNVYNNIHVTPIGQQLSSVMSYNLFLTFLNNSFSKNVPFLCKVVTHFLVIFIFLKIIVVIHSRKNLLITFISLFVIWLLNYFLFRIYYEWDGFIPFLAVILLGVSKELLFYYNLWKENQEIKDAMIIDDQTSLPKFTYYIMHLRNIFLSSTVSDQNYLVTISMDRSKTSHLELKEISLLLKKKIKFREIASCSKEDNVFYLILKGTSIFKITKRIKHHLLKPLENRFNLPVFASVIPVSKIKIKTVQSVLSILKFATEIVNQSKVQLSLFDESWEKDIADSKLEDKIDMGKHISDQEFITQQIRESQENISTLEEKLKQSAKEIMISQNLANVGKTAAQIVHELKNPLGNLVNMKTWFAKYVKPEDPINKCIDAVHNESTRMLDLCHRILQFSRPDKEEKTNVDLNFLIKETLKFLAGTITKSEVSLKTNLSSKVKEVFMNSDQIKQVLLNLTMNAVESMCQGGNLLVETELEDNIVSIKITDTGIGISPENIDKIFDLFFTTKGDKGTGIGLSLCFDIIKKHSGRILVKSELTKGTTFTIMLPA